MGDNEVQRVDIEQLHREKMHKLLELEAYVNQLHVGIAVLGTCSTILGLLVCIRGCLRQGKSKYPGDKGS
jgi:hypothetical protein